MGRYSDIVITLVDFQVLGLKSPYLDIALGRSHAGERVKVEVGVSLFFLLLFPILFLMIFPVSRHGSPTCELTRESKRSPSSHKVLIIEETVLTSAKVRGPWAKGEGSQSILVSSQVPHTFHSSFVSSGDSRVWRHADLFGW